MNLSRTGLERRTEEVVLERGLSISRDSVTADRIKCIETESARGSLPPVGEVESLVLASALKLPVGMFRRVAGRAWLERQPIAVKDHFYDVLSEELRTRQIDPTLTIREEQLVGLLRRMDASPGRGLGYEPLSDRLCALFRADESALVGVFEEPKLLTEAIQAAGRAPKSTWTTLFCWWRDSAHLARRFHGIGEWEGREAGIRDGSLRRALGEAEAEE